ncbi:hypothetical protein P280DRAFT_323078 [Massarina eburnea CBS 473.64]|uniref:PEBP-like protein n=1 Tax=Massarina eburnea CBS 473.64 TaxID=1395130 RepID=A0A6A6RZV8_9PLEO|nr:hypothetical protein P280DRAFT_323078 [Massarina eburnea CBS 473.64]
MQVDAWNVWTLTCEMSLRPVMSLTPVKVCNVVYIPARPPRGHGPHRYYFELVALDEKLSRGKLGAVPSKKEVVEAIEGKVVGWELWVGTYESRL